MLDFQFSGLPMRFHYHVTAASDTRGTSVTGSGQSGADKKAFCSTNVPHLVARQVSTKHADEVFSFEVMEAAAGHL